MKKNVNLDTTVNVGSNYAGQVVNDIIGKTFRESESLRLNLLTLVENVNYKLNLRKIEFTSGRKDYSCGFTPAGAVTLSEKVLEIKKIVSELEICKEDFRPTWSDELQGSSAWNERVASDIEEAIIAEVLGEEQEHIGESIWAGTTASGSFPGLLAQFDADSDVIDVVGTTASITEANVEAELKKALAAVPVALRNKALNVMVSADIYQAYWFLLVSKGISNGLGAEDKQVRFGRYTITEVTDFPAKTIVIAEQKNLVLAVGNTGDMNLLAAVDQDAIGLLTGTVRFKMVYGAAVGYYNGEDIVYYQEA